MKKDSINKVKLGIFVAIGLLIFIAGIYYIGETKKLFSTTFRISALFKDVNGLQVGNNVRFAGINVGSIEGIMILSDSTVKVDMIIDENTKKFIRKDSKAVIGTDGMMGNKIMTISPGTVEFAEIENNDRINTIIPVSLDDMIKQLKVTSDNAALITNDLAAILSSIRNGDGTVGKLLFDKKYAQNIDNVLENVSDGSAGFKNAFDQEFADNLDGIMVNVEESTKELKQVIVEAQDSWLLGSFWGDSSDDEDTDKLKKQEDKKKATELKKADDLKRKEILIEEKKTKEELLQTKNKSKQQILDDKKKLKEDEKKRLKRVKEIYEEEIMREKLEKKNIEEKKQFEIDSLKNIE